MAFEATFRHGEPRMIDHTPAGAIAAGEVVIVGDLPLIAHRDIAADTLGALAAGYGVYRSLADAAIAKGLRVFWDNTANRVTVTATGNKALGVTVSAAGAADAEIDFLHDPGVVS